MALFSSPLALAPWAQEAQLASPPVRRLLLMVSVALSLWPQALEVQAVVPSSFRPVLERLLQEVQLR